MKRKKNKKRGLDKLLLGVVIGGAVGSVVGAGISSRRKSKSADEAPTIKPLDKSHKKPKNAFVKILRSFRLYLRNKNAKKK